MVLVLLDRLGSGAEGSDSGLDSGTDAGLGVDLGSGGLEVELLFLLTLPLGLGLGLELEGGLGSLVVGLLDTLGSSVRVASVTSFFFIESFLPGALGASGSAGFSGSGSAIEGFFFTESFFAGAGAGGDSSFFCCFSGTESFFLMDNLRF